MGIPWLEILLMGGIALGTMAAGYVLEKIVFHRLSKWAGKTETEIDDFIIDLIRKPFIFWCLLLGLWIGQRVVALPPKILQVTETVLLCLFLLSITVVAGKGIAGLIGFYSRRKNSEIAVTSVIQNVARVLVIVVGLLIILESVGINVAPLLTVLGVGSLAIALALQDTLSNLFAGIYIALARTVRIDDYIRLESGQEGYVVDIGWRATQIRSVQNTIIIIPNARLSQSIVTNFHLPEKHIPVNIGISFGYDEDVERIERVVLEETRKAIEGGLSGLRSSPEPYFRFIPGFGAYSLDSTLTVYVEEFYDQYFVQHELRKRILNRFRIEGIRMPFPTRVVQLQSDSTP